MKTFSQLADEVKPNGGNAVEGVTRINQENVYATYASFIEILGPVLCLKPSLTAIIGSAGKKRIGETSGDIDVAIEIPHSKDLRFDIFDFFLDELRRGEYRVRDMRSIGIVSLAYPITNHDGKQPDAFVQIDLMIVDNIEYAKWGFYSPHYSNSKYKGLYRNELNFFIAKHARMEPTVVQDGIVVEWSRRWFSTSAGLLCGIQTLVSAKTGKTTKTPRVVSKDVITNDPDEVCRFLYGVDSRLVLTLEDALDAMKSETFPHKQHIPAIIADTVAGIEKKGYPVPDIIRDFE